MRCACPLGLSLLCTPNVSPALMSTNKASGAGRQTKRKLRNSASIIPCPFHVETVETVKLAVLPVDNDSDKSVKASFEYVILE